MVVRDQIDKGNQQQITIKKYNNNTKENESCADDTSSKANGTTKPNIRMPVSSFGRQRTTPAAHVRNLIQQKLPVGPMTQKSCCFSSWDWRRTTGAVSKNPIVRLEQTNLAGEILAVKDSEAFGSEFPKPQILTVLLLHFRTLAKWTNTPYRPNLSKLPKHSKIATLVLPCMPSIVFTKLVRELSNSRHVW